MLVRLCGLIEHHEKLSEVIQIYESNSEVFFFIFFSNVLFFYEYENLLREFNHRDITIWVISGEIQLQVDHFKCVHLFNISYKDSLLQHSEILKVVNIWCVVRLCGLIEHHEKLSEVIQIHESGPDVFFLFFFFDVSFFYEYENLIREFKHSDITIWVIFGEV